MQLPDDEKEHPYASPADFNRVTGIKFDIDFHNILHNTRQLNASWTRYRIKDMFIDSEGCQGHLYWVMVSS